VSEVRAARTRLWVLVSIASLAVGLVWVGLRKGGMLTLSDVGHLPALAELQDQLRPLEACHLEYARRDKHGHRGHFENVFISPCNDESVVILVKVDDSWGRRGVGFQLSRSAVDQPWKVLVEKDEVPFTELLGALHAFAPVISTEYGRKLRERAMQPPRAAPQIDEAARRKAARDSYPE
jgi:hypothetical protein